MLLEVKRARSKQRGKERQALKKEALNVSGLRQPESRAIRYDDVRSAMAEEGVIRLLFLDGSLADRCGDVPVYTGDRAVLAGLTGYALTRGMLCAMRRPTLPGPEAVCRDARRLAVLENVTDASNVGAIFRSAAALGMDGVLVAPSCCDPFYRRAVRVSMGTVFQVPWAWLDGDAWPRPVLDRLAARGFRTVALALREDSLSIDDPALTGAERVAVLLGSEGEGLSEGAIAACACTARIPMSRGVDSLNVAAAGAVVFWQLRPRTAPPERGRTSDALSVF